MRHEILVFKTTVTSQEAVDVLAQKLDALDGVARWNFDLDDCDRVLRIVSINACPEAIRLALQQHGFTCEPLEDVVETMSL